MRTNRRTLALLTTTATVLASPLALAQSAPPPANDPYGNSVAGPGLSAGGLAPPGSGTSGSSNYDPGQSPSTVDTLEQADKRDSGRGLEFIWARGEVGYQTLSLNTFHANDLVDAATVQTSQNGPMFGVAAGVRLIFLTLGGHFRYGDFSAWQLWTLDAEAGLHFPIGKLEPYFSFAAGYASVGSLNSLSNVQGAGVDIHGWNARMGFGVDYYFNHYLSVGALLTGDALYLKRKSQTLAIPPELASDPRAAQAQRVYANDGSSWGGAGTLSLVVGFHF